MTNQSETQTNAKIQSGKYLTFVLGNESYGVAVLKVREIIKMQDITVVPQMPSYLKGVINLRGKIIPIIDLRIKFGLADLATTDNTCIIVVNQIHNGVQHQIGLIVDGVEEVSNINSEEIEETPDFGADVSCQYIIGMAKIKGSVKTLLDIDKVVGGDDIINIQGLVP